MINSKSKAMQDKTKDALNPDATEHLRAYLHTQLVHYQEPRNPKVIHSSDLSKVGVSYCPRAQALRIEKPNPKENERIGTSLAYTFRVGRMVESWLQNEVLRGILFGDWRCQACNHVHKRVYAPEVCEVCNTSVKPLYQEINAVSSVSGASSGLDGLAYDGVGLRLLEFKTIKDEDFNKLEAPLHEHRTRTNFYLRVISEDPSLADIPIHTDYAIVLYTSKGFGKKDSKLQTILKTSNKVYDSQFSPFKAYAIHRDDTKTEHMHEASLSVTEYLNSGKLPVRICDTKTCELASKCFYKDECFKR